ncbi:MAG TPA: YHYH domain-containing protein, partial [Candidatus Woesebacteria bacterium]|nr:YHYH domain-containing protein [Candidatus Woesebacteria bacterium]
MRYTFFIILFLFLSLVPRIEAHSGRTDSSGGHNCNVGACAGTYHYHNGGYEPPPVREYEPRYIAPQVEATTKPSATSAPLPTSTPVPPTDTPMPT